jgi:hypothetical protein
MKKEMVALIDSTSLGVGGDWRDLAGALDLLDSEVR